MTEAPQRRFEIKPAVRSRVPLMIGLSGPSGAGKTYSALRLATGIKEVAGGEIVFIDTENQRARHYADLFKFRHIDFAPPYGSRDYLDALAAATRRPPGVIVIDSLSHEHEGEGGLLDFYAMELQRLAGDDPSPQQRAQRFGPGNRANPRGRPKGSLNLSTRLKRAARTKVTVTVNGRRVTMDKIDAALTQLMNLAASGNLRRS